MQKEPFTDKLIKRFYGIAGPLDEYKRREVDKIGNIAFIILFPTILLGNAIAFLVGIHHPKTVAFCYPLILEGLIFIASFYVIFKGRTAGISEFEEEELTRKEQKQVKYGGLKAGAFFGVWMYLSQGLLVLIIDQQPFLETLVKPKNIILGILAGLFFGASTHLIVRNRMRKGEK